ncbi:MAG: type II CAAX endopeptidase family protein [Clostridiales bacterium]|nr:type II CAAX endopeptidase family protein [Clostridiales bacterium]
MRKASYSFRFPMSKTELLPGAIYIPVHIIVLDFLVPLVMKAAAPSASQYWSDLVYFSVSFLFILIVMHSYLARSFTDLVQCRMDALTAIVVGYFGYYIARWLMSLIFWIVGWNGFPAVTGILSQVRLNSGVMPIVSIILAPIVEEVLFRGVVFGGLRHKSRALAYIVSFLVFGFYCVWSRFFSGFGWELLIDFLYYLPVSLALCWCYEKGGSIWAPVLLHMLINILSISLTITP